MKNAAFLLFAAFLFSCSDKVSESASGSVPVEESPAQPSLDSLRLKIQDIIRSGKGDIGVGIIGLETGDTLSVNGDSTYVMMSVAKFAQALFVMHQVDEGKLRLNQPVTFTKADMVSGTFSLLRDERKVRDGHSLPLIEVLKYSVSHSDNIAFDKLYEAAGNRKR